MVRPHSRGIFCLEGDWWNDLNHSSTVKPVLKLLSGSADQPIPFVHRDVGTVQEMRYYLAKWANRGMSKYPLLYLAFHGTNGTLHVGDRRRSGSDVDLQTLAEWLDGRLKGRIVHFGSCETLGADRRHIQRFLRRTGATAATGFRESIDWLKSSAFEVLMFDVMLRRPFTVASAQRIKQDLWREIPGLARQLEFRMEIRDP